MNECSSCCCCMYYGVKTRRTWYTGCNGWSILPLLIYRLGPAVLTALRCAQVCQMCTSMWLTGQTTISQNLALEMMEYFEIMGYYVGVSSLKWWVYPASQSFWVMYQNEHDVFLHRQEAMEGLSLVTKRNFTDWKKKAVEQRKCLWGNKIWQWQTNIACIDRRYPIILVHWSIAD